MLSQFIVLFLTQKCTHTYLIYNPMFYLYFCSQLTPVKTIYYRPRALWPNLNVSVRNLLYNVFFVQASSLDLIKHSAEFPYRTTRWFRVRRALEHRSWASSPIECGKKQAIATPWRRPGWHFTRRSDFYNVSSYRSGDFLLSINFYFDLPKHKNNTC